MSVAIAKKWCNTYALLTSQPLELAEYVLNKCITKEEPKQEIAVDGKNFVDSTSTDTADQPVHYNFEYLEDNVLDCMVSQDTVRVLESYMYLQHTNFQFVNDSTLLYIQIKRCNYRNHTMLQIIVFLNHEFRLSTTG